ncbi:MAG: 16S rRNA (guanine(527)-N(7))-methyltransferase RsmG [Chloroflexi bacterium]|nr:16S rRNA (guanine(527)-N(7))-methyltransferase RsmG [Chloroflexota bacterium]
MFQNPKIRTQSIDPLNLCIGSPNAQGKLPVLESVVTAAKLLGIDLDGRQLAQFQRYRELIELRSNQFNLTGHKTWDKIREELFIRSLRMFAPAGGSVPTPGWFAGKRAIDIGSGAGIPGMVMKIVLPELQMTLLDSIQKRTNFLIEVANELELKGLEIINGRAEELGHERDHREQYDVVTARAVARLTELAELTIPFANIGGTVILPKSQGVEDEVIEAAGAAEILGAAPALTLTVSKPGNSPPDDMVYWMKISPTPQEFPRKVGVPHQSPLVERSAEND